jgi:hypothetical protein
VSLFFSSGRSALAAWSGILSWARARWRRLWRCAQGAHGRPDVVPEADRLQRRAGPASLTPSHKAVDRDEDVFQILRVLFP